MKKFAKLSITLFVAPLVFSCATGTNDSKSSIKRGINEQCTIDVYCENCYFACGTNPDEFLWSKEGSLSAPVGERFEIYFNAKTGYNLPSNVYSIREKDTGTDIDEYIFKDEANNKKIIFTPTTSTVIQMIADYDCVNITWSTTTNDEKVGFSYNGGLNFVDWGDGIVDSESTHAYKIAGSHTAKICGNIDSIMVGTNNPATNLYYPGNQDIKEITIKDTISSIPTGAFSNLPNLEKISIANSVTNISTRSFSGSNALKNINFEEDNPIFKSFNGTDIVNTTTKTLIYSNSNDKIASTVNKIADYAFEGATIKNIVIPKNITSIGSKAFNNCLSLKSVDLTGYTAPPNIVSDSFSDSITSIQTANETVAQSFKTAWEDLPSIINKISYPSSGEFQILPLEDGILKLSAVSSSDTVPQTLSFYIKDYNEDPETWLGPMTYTGQANKTVALYLGEVKANTPIALKAASNNVTLSTVSSGKSDTHWTFSCWNTEKTAAIPYSVSGKLLSLVDPAYLDEDNPQSMPDGAHFSYLFDEGLIDASNLIMASDVKQSCYVEMFRDCKSLENAPKLPCKDLSSYDATYCYSYMFYGCTNLINAPELPSSTTTDYCYYYMFHSCVALKKAPNLPSSTAETYCYAYMFYDCISLVNSPTISATVVKQACCMNMFNSCNSLENTSVSLLASTLAVNCYGSMYANCSNLKKCCELPATTLEQGCYTGMFNGCSSLTKGPTVLPATSLPPTCYAKMFSSCTKLITPPIIMATGPKASSSSQCLAQMFSKCSSLNIYPGNIGKVFFDSTNFKSTQLTNMFQNVNGTAGATPAINTKFSYSERTYLAFTSSTSTATLSYEIIGSLPEIHIQSSNDLLNWTDWDGSAITIPSGVSLYVKNLSNTLSTSKDSYFNFVTNEATLSTSGSVNSLINFAPLSDYCFCKLFADCELSNCNFVIPSTTLKKYCYCSMFEGATGFKNTTMDFPATTLAEGCYMNMFKGSVHLMAGPTSAKFAATSLEPFCCYGMFEDCSALMAAGANLTLNFVSLADHSCERMFYNCTKYVIYEGGTDPSKIIFTCPSTASLIEPVKDMYVGTGVGKAGAFTGTPTAGSSYYR